MLHCQHCNVGFFVIEENISWEKGLGLINPCPWTYVLLGVKYMEKIVVSGAYSGVGKSTFIDFLLSLPYSTAVVKYSIHEEMDGFEVVDRKEAIEQTGKDTALFACKAQAVYLIRTSKRFAKRALKGINFPGAIERVVFEGNTAAGIVPGAYHIFIASTPYEKWKPSAFEALLWADLIVLNKKNTDVKRLTDKIHLFNKDAAMEEFNLHEAGSLEREKIDARIRGFFQWEAAILDEISKRGNVKSLSCQEAHLIAKKLGVKVGLVGKVLEENSIKISQCQLGVF